MTFNEGIRTDPSRGRASRGRGAMVVGGVGGLGGIMVLLVYLFLGGDPASSPLTIPGDDGGAQEQSAELDKCRTGADANRYSECRVLATAESLDAVWSELLPAQADVRYEQPGLTLFTGSVATGCGDATSSTGPFYCPADQSVYLDVAFYEALETQLGARNEPLAQEYVIAHEFGHHIQNQTGQLRRVAGGDTGPASSSVRSELQADCYAGIWVARAASSVDPESGETFLKAPTDRQIDDALTAAAAVGDDRIQAAAGSVNPETWTHGAAEQRVAWFTRGYQSGQMGACNTWDVARP